MIIINTSCELPITMNLATYHSWFVEILVTNIIESVIWTESKQLAGYIFVSEVIGWLYITEPISNVAMPAS